MLQRRTRIYFNTRNLNSSRNTEFYTNTIPLNRFCSLKSDSSNPKETHYILYVKIMTNGVNAQKSFDTCTMKCDHIIQVVFITVSRPSFFVILKAYNSHIYESVAIFLLSILNKESFYIVKNNQFDYSV